MSKKSVVLPITPDEAFFSNRINAEQLIYQTLTRIPTSRLYDVGYVIDTGVMFTDRPVMRQKQEVKIEEIGNEL